MNMFKNLKTNLFTSLVLRFYMILPVVLALLSFSPVRAKDEAYDYVMEIETKKLKRQFDYAGSNLNDKIVKCDVYFYPINMEKKSKQERFHSPDTRHYKKMWHYQAKTLGMEQVHEFDIPENQGFAIKISHKDDAGSAIENRAAADAIVRLAVDLYLRKQHLVSVKVPQSDWHAIADGLSNDKGFHIVPVVDIEHPVDSKMSIFLTSEEEPVQYKDTFHYL